MENIIMLTRDLGAAIQQSDAYLAHKVAHEAADGDQKLQDLIGAFNLKKIALGQEVQKGDEKDTEKVTALNNEVREMYTDIMQYPAMMAYNTTKGDMDHLIGYIQQIITGSVNGEDPYTIEENEGGCSGSCSSCSGCH